MYEHLKAISGLFVYKFIIYIFIVHKNNFTTY